MSRPITLFTGQWADLLLDPGRLDGSYAEMARAESAMPPKKRLDGNIYREAFRAIAAEVQGRRPSVPCDFPTIADGVEGMAFLGAAVRSAKRDARWVKMP